jgi:hypothetical protein
LSSNWLTLQSLRVGGVSGSELSSRATKLKINSCVKIMEKPILNNKLMVNRQGSFKGNNKFGLTVKTPINKAMGNSIVNRITLNDINPSKSHFFTHKQLNSIDKPQVMDDENGNEKLMSQISL